MTRQEQKAPSEARKQAKIEAKVERHESKAWDKNVQKWKEKGAWVEPIQITEENARTLHY